MSRRSPLLLLLLLAAPPCPAAAPPPTPRDLHGDPLPPRALARMGTLRLRHAAWCRACAADADGKTAVTLSDEDGISRWDLATGRLLGRATLPISTACSVVAL